MNFDDEQLADEKSIANMKVKYATLNNCFQVKTLQQEKNTNILDIGQNIKLDNKYLQFLREQSNDDARDFINELIKVNNLELEDLKQNFNGLANLDKSNPQYVYRPYNLCVLNKKMAQNNLMLVSQLFDEYIKESRIDVKKMLEEMIKRRIENLGRMF